jgi:hypothetical protein
VRGDARELYFQLVDAVAEVVEVVVANINVFRASVEDLVAS